MTNAQMQADIVAIWTAIAEKHFENCAADRSRCASKKIYDAAFPLYAIGKKTRTKRAQILINYMRCTSRSWRWDDPGVFFLFILPEKLAHRICTVLYLLWGEYPPGLGNMGNKKKTN